MLSLIHQLILQKSDTTQDRTALTVKDKSYSYSAMQSLVKQCASGLSTLGLNRFERVGIYLPKTLENITALFATSAIGGVFVPINPVLKPIQVQHIINDCNVKVLFTNWARYQSLLPVIDSLTDLQTVVITDKKDLTESTNTISIICWSALMNQEIDRFDNVSACQSTSSDMAAIFYTSGSTGKPKGVVLSHGNILTGAISVSTYLKNTPTDKILAVLPLSFDYGFSQITSAFYVNAEVILLDYFLPNDVIKAVKKHQVTGLAGVPPLWSQLAKLNWQDNASSIRYFTNSGGALNQVLLSELRSIMVNAEPYLMYGLTEAFRSTYLSPELIDSKPTSMGKAIPNAEVIVIRKDGSECDINETGELVHIGPLVSLGYWNDPVKTQTRFKPSPTKPNGIIPEQLAVYSGDMVKRDADGDLYFIGRNDEMIKSSGYRISPVEVEECLYQFDGVHEAVVIGVPHQDLGQAILAIIALKSVDTNSVKVNVIEKEIGTHCQKSMANFMQPAQIILLDKLPKNSNGKLDRALLAKRYYSQFNNEVDHEK